MQFRYNLALTPRDKRKANSIIKLAQKFSTIADRYVLGNHSLPHVTLYQFDADENDILAIWKTALRSLEEKSFYLKFNEFSCLTFDNKLYWVSLLPHNSQLLHEMHVEVAALLGLPVKQKFDPHMTLIRTVNQSYKIEVDKIAKMYTPISDWFDLSLGRSDDIGQFIELVYTQSR